MDGLISQHVSALFCADILQLLKSTAMNRRCSKNWQWHQSLNAVSADTEAQGYAWLFQLWILTVQVPYWVEVRLQVSPEEELT